MNLRVYVVDLEDNDRQAVVGYATCKDGACSADIVVQSEDAQAVEAVAALRVITERAEREVGDPEAIDRAVDAYAAAA